MALKIEPYSTTIVHVPNAATPMPPAPVGINQFGMLVMPGDIRPVPQGGNPSAPPPIPEVVIAPPDETARTGPKGQP